MLKTKGDALDGKRCLVSGAGNVAQYAAQKLIELGGRVLTLSDRTGFIYAADGLTDEQLNFIIALKTQRRGSLTEAAEEFGLEFVAGARPWTVPCDAAFPCATQNELDGGDAQSLLKNGCMLVCEGANMPTTLEGIQHFEAARILYAPGKAANAGGVSISGLEMTQNAMHLTWSREEVDAELQTIMRRIHEQCVAYGQEGTYVDYVKGANIAGFVKVADAMLAYGIV